MFLVLFLPCAAAVGVFKSLRLEGNTISRNRSLVICNETTSSFAHWNQTDSDKVRNQYAYIFVHGTCIENAEPDRQDRLPRAYCKSDGSWDIARGCVCSAGSQINNGSCEKCPPAHFSARNSAVCRSSCPPHSDWSDHYTMCDCEPEFYRIGYSDEEPCYGVPSDVQNLRANQIGQTEVELVWKRPVYDGGLPDLKYLVHCDSYCVRDEKVSEERAVMKGLKPNTNYLFRVTAINKVSGQHTHPSDHGMEVRVRTVDLEIPILTDSIGDEESSVDSPEKRVQGTEQESSENTATLAGHFSSLLAVLVALLMHA